MKTARHWKAVLGLLPALIGTAACGTGSTAETGEAVYGRPLAEQFHAATEATQQAGTARFVSTLTYASAGGEAVHRTNGGQDYAARTSHAALVLQVAEGFPEDAAKYIGEPGKAVQQTLATAADAVYVRREDSSWLRYTPAAFNELGASANELAAHTPGEVAPYSGTLADLVPRTVPREEPKREADGGRVYRVTALPEVAAELLPSAVKSGDNGWGSKPVQMSVRLDAEGRLSEVSADLGPLLESLHKDRILVGVTSLNASYRLSAFGEPLRSPTPGKDVEDAEKVLALIGTLKGGECASFTTGLTAKNVVRPVDCRGKHDLRVFAQTSLDRSFPGQVAIKDGTAYAQEQCGEAYAKAPRNWVRDSSRPGAVHRVVIGVRLPRCGSDEDFVDRRLHLLRGHFLSRRGGGAADPGSRARRRQPSQLP
ncbi:hypothetical protein [Streptomyces sp. Tu 2975]|uniref:hypothetical protein n=1 Tax=Streptomyces sp. Tu 2975 TaxID=2676871 RepID=UPI001FC97FE6|nr:hypothetical protein [Streptomyces sp. Tu 2975]